MAQSDASKVGMEMSAGVKIYLGVLGLVGAGVMVAGAVLGWGFWGWFGGGFLVVAGWGGLATQFFKIGWQPAVGPCPSCGHALHFTTKKQYVRCEKCEAFLMVQGKKLATVGGQITSDKPEYPVPYVHGVTFPSMCMLCGQPATQTEAVRYEHRKRKGTLIVATVYEVRKLAVNVPVCAQHAGQRAVIIEYGDHPSTQHGGVSLKFRSLPALEAFRQHNAAIMPPILNEAQMTNAPKLPAA